MDWSDAVLVGIVFCGIAWFLLMGVLIGRTLERRRQSEQDFWDRMRGSVVTSVTSDGSPSDGWL